MRQKETEWVIIAKLAVHKEEKREMGILIGSRIFPFS